MVEECKFLAQKEERGRRVEFPLEGGGDLRCAEVSFCSFYRNDASETGSGQMSPRDL